MTILQVRYRSQRPRICHGCGLRPIEPEQRLCRHCLDLAHQRAAEIRGDRHVRRSLCWCSLCQPRGEAA